MPVTFPDGSTAQVTYPPSLDVAGLGARPYWVGCGHDFGFHYFDPFGVVYEGEPLETYTGADGQPVSLWRGVRGNGPIDYLIFRFGPWTVDLYQYRNRNGQRGVSPVHDRRDCAENLVGRVTRDGWLILDGPDPVRLPTEAAGPPEGSEMDFGSLDRSFIEMWPGPCSNEPTPDTTLIDGVYVDLSRDFASWCDREEMMRVHVYFKAGSDFFRRVFEGLGVERVKLAR